MKTRLFANLLAIVIGGLSLCADAAAAPTKRQAGVLSAPEVHLQSPVVEVPMSLATRHPVVDVKINGQGPFKFVLDTGAGGTMIDDRLAERLHLPSIGEVLVGDASGGPPRPARLVQIDSITLGAAGFASSTGIVDDLQRVFRDDDAPGGILAFNTFADCLMTLDYPRRRVVLERGALPPPDGEDILEYKETHRIPALALSIGKVPVEVTIDSGAAVAGVLAASLEGKVPLQARPVLARMGRRMNTEMEIREARIDSTVRLGRHRLAKPIVHFGGAMSVIGYDVLKHFAITFDQNARTVRFARPSSEPITFPPGYTAGFGTDLIDGARQVWYVIGDLPARRAGLRVNDLVKSLNGRPAADYDYSTWRSMTENPGELRMTVERAGRPLDIVLETVIAVP